MNIGHKRSAMSKSIISLIHTEPKNIIEYFLYYLKLVFTECVRELTYQIRYLQSDLQINVETLEHAKFKKKVL